MLIKILVGILFFYAITSFLHVMHKFLFNFLVDWRKWLMIWTTIVVGVNISLLGYASATALLISTTVVVLLIQLIYFLLKRKQNVLQVTLGHYATSAIWKKLYGFGKSWGVTNAFIRRATQASIESIEAIHALLNREDQVYINFYYANPALTAVVIYKGDALDLTVTKPTRDDMLTEQQAMQHLAVYMLKEYADYVTYDRVGSVNHLRFIIKR